jgi:hypothetical protein
MNMKVIPHKKIIINSFGMDLIGEIADITSNAVVENQTRVKNIDITTDVHDELKEILDIPEDHKMTKIIGYDLRIVEGTNFLKFYTDKYIVIANIGYLK